MKFTVHTGGLTETPKKASEKSSPTYARLNGDPNILAIRRLAPNLLKEEQQPTPRLIPVHRVKNLRAQYRAELMKYTEMEKVVLEDSVSRMLMIFQRAVNPDGTLGAFVFQEDSLGRMKKSEVQKGAYTDRTSVIGPNCLISKEAGVLARSWIEGVQLFDHSLVCEDTIALHVNTPNMAFGNTTISGKAPNIPGIRRE